MTENDWKVEMHQLLDMFERESIISLRRIRRSFEATDRPFDENFHQYFLRMLTLRLDTSFNIVQFEQLHDDQMQMTPNCSTSTNGNEMENNTNASSDTGGHVDSMNMLQNDSSKGGNNVEAPIDIVDSDEDDLIEKQPTQATIRGQMESNAWLELINEVGNPDDQHNSSDLDTENGIKVDVKCEIKAEGAEDELVDLPLIEFDPTENNGSPNPANDAFVTDLSSSPSLPSVSSKTMKRSTHKNIFRCENCDYTTQDRRNFNRHQLIHGGIKAFKCDHCEYASRTKGNLKRHQRIHDGQKLMGIARDCKDGTYKCPNCDQQFTELGFLGSHVTRSHKNNRRLFNCVRCMRPFAQKTEKDRHEIGCENRRYECYLCKKYFTRDVTNLRRHMRTHSGAKSFQSTICNEYFRAKTNLNTHFKQMHNHA